MDPHLQRLNRGALAHLRDEWKARRLTIVVGAGASVQSGLPSWYSVLDEMLFRYVEGKHRKTLVGPLSDRIREHMRARLQGESPIVMAHYLRSQYSSDAQFLKLVHSALYRSVGGSPKPGPITRAIARLANDLHGSLKSVITFNYDDLVESALNAQGVPNTSVWQASHWAGVNGLPVYHPHGFLPFKMKKGEPYWVVLSESDYHAQYATPHSWSNIVFTQALLDSTCLFVSTSLTDPNLRRMLDVMHQSTRERFHYFMWETPAPGAISDAVEEVSARAFENVFVKAHELIGLKPVWFHYRGDDPTGKDVNYGWRDIPDLLGAIAHP